jgi:hypothetical protein
LPIALTAPSNAFSAFGTGTAPFNLSPGSGTIRPNYTAGCSKAGPGSPHSAARVNQWFNTTCFTAPTGNFDAFGNEPRVDPSIKSEGADNWDVSLNKSFGITERAKLKFAAEFFDVFNHAQFSAPGTGNQQVTGGSFGAVTTTNNLPRTVQVSLRLSY